LRNLVNYKKSVQKREKEKLTTNLELFDNGMTKECTHTIFLETQEEAADFNPAEYFDTDERLLTSNNRLRKEQLNNITVSRYSFICVCSYLVMKI